MTTYAVWLSDLLKNDNVFFNLKSEHFAQIQAYMDDSMTAAIFPKDNSSTSASKEIVTSESLYSSNVCPIIFLMECQKVALNRLIALIKGFAMVKKGQK